MKLLLYISAFAILLSTANAQQKTPEFLWTRTASAGTDYDSEGKTIVVDKDGNNYVYGISGGKVEFGNNIVLENSGKPIYFFAKYNNDGIAQWAKPLILSNNGHVLVAMDSVGSFYFSNYQSFAKYDSQLNLLWTTKKIGASQIGSIAVDRKGNSYICGSLFDTTLAEIDFGNGISLPVSRLSFFLAKYNAEGKCVWAKKSETTNQRSGAADINIANDENIIISGGFENSLSFGNGISLDTSGGFIAKYNSDGNIIWGRKTTFDSTSTGALIKFSLDKNNAIYGFGYAPLAGSNLSFWIAKYTSDGTNVWGKLIYKKDSIFIDFEVSDIATDSEGKTYICGYFGKGSQPVTIPFGNNLSLSSQGGSAGFIAQYDGNGTTLSAAKIPHRYINRFSIDMDKDGNAYICGQVQDTATFSINLWLAKYGIKSTTDIENNELLKTNQILTIHPNPAHSTSRISFKTTLPSYTRLTFTDVLGRQTLLKEETLDAGEHRAEINTANFPAGIYVLTLEAEGQVFSQTVVIER